MGVHAEENPNQLSLSFSGVTIVTSALHEVLRRIKEKSTFNKARMENGRLIVPYNNSQFFAAHIAIEAAEQDSSLKDKIKFEWRNQKYGYNQVVFDLETQAVEFSRIAYAASNNSSENMPKPIIITSKLMNYDVETKRYFCQAVEGLDINNNTVRIGVNLNRVGYHEQPNDIKCRGKRFIMAVSAAIIAQVNKEDWRNIVLKIDADAGNVSEWKPKVLSRNQNVELPTMHRQKISGLIEVQP